MSFSPTRPHKRRGAIDVRDDQVSRIPDTLQYRVLNGIIYDFSALGNQLGPALANLWATELCRYYLRYAVATTRARHRALMAMFEWMGTQNSLRQDQLRAHARKLYSDKSDIWKKLVADYAAKDLLPPFESGEITGTTYAENLGNLWLPLDQLAAVGLAARCPKPALPHNYHASGKPRPTLLELQRGNAPLEVVAELVARVKQLGITDIEGETAHLIQALAGRVKIESISTEADFARAIYLLNDESLVQLRGLVEKEYLHWAAIFDEGQALLASAEDVATFEIALALGLPREKRNAELKALFPENDERAARGRMLRYLQDVYYGMPPSSEGSKWPTVMRAVYQRLGGQEKLDAAFAIHRQAVGAAALLYIIDAGANVSSATNVLTDFERPDDNPGLVIVDTVKPRVGPESIYSTLPIQASDVKVSAVQALRGIKAMTAARREQLQSQPNDILFIFWWQGKLHYLDDQAIARCLNYILRDGGLAHAYVPSSIRGAVGIQASSAADKVGSHDPVRIRMKHGPNSTATPLYGLRLPLKLLLERRIRHFTDTLQIAWASNTPHGLKAIGIKDVDVASAIAKVVRTGLGPHCAVQSTGPATKNVDAHGTCRDVGECPSCIHKIVVADLQAIAESIATRDLILEKQKELEASDAPRYEHVWIDLLAFSTVFIEKVSTSASAHLLPRAKLLAKELRASGFDPTQLRPAL